MKTIVYVIFFSIVSNSFASISDSTKIFTATRAKESPKIDGKLDDVAWQNVKVASDFTQRAPFDKQHESQNTEVKIIYTDYAIYVGAYMHDTSPDSILKQLGKRDQDGLNSDRFFFKIDPYNNQQDAFQFGVTASGIQLDSKFSDGTFDAVWSSSVGMSEDGWIVEMEIPYSAIRFPNTNTQEWGFQLTRDIRRNREFDVWSYVPNTASNPQVYWGKLIGINNLKTPVRLSLTPYIGASFENTPMIDENGNNKYNKSLSYNFGADVKYGIDDRFTLDMSLLPDFGQVQSDKKIKNLGYNEVVYDENRPFFKEGTELFQKGNLFYSRRIGKTPSGYESVYDNLKDGEVVEENPIQVKLINATKISGRTNKGLGIGYFNSITNNTYAKIKSTDGNTREILTEPLTNYNILVLDQQFKNNSEIYLINTSTIRSNNYTNANVTGAGLKISNKKNTYEVKSEGALSQRYYKNTEVSPNNAAQLIGYKYFIGASKLGGNFSYGIGRTVRDTNYRSNDLGYYENPGQIDNNTYLNFNLYKPWKFIRESFNTVQFNYSSDFKTGKIGYNEISLNLFFNNLKYNGFFLNGGISPSRSYDYYEPRTPNRFFYSYRYYFVQVGISSDYRKKLAFDYSFQVSNFIDRFKSEGYKNRISFRVRPTDKLFIIYSLANEFDPYNVGYAGTATTDTIIFGTRRVETWVNEINLNYIFNKDMSLSLIGRHYWNTGKYNNYYTLKDDGDLIDNISYIENNDFNFNSFNIDLVYEWRFSPGSTLNIIYKKGIQNETELRSLNFSKNFNSVINSPEITTFAVKLLYYLDYQKIHLRKSKA